MELMFLSAKSDISISDGALYSLIGFIIVLTVLALLVGIFYLSGYIFQSKAFNKAKSDKSEKTKESSAPAAAEDETDEQTVAAITAAIAYIYGEEAGESEAPEFVIRRIKRTK